MSAILNSLNAHYMPIFQPILIILVSKFMVHRVLSDKIYLSLKLLSPLNLSFKSQLHANYFFLPNMADGLTKNKENLSILHQLSSFKHLGVYKLSL